MTSSTGGIPDTQVPDARTATSQTKYVPAIALTVALMAAQHAGFVVYNSAAGDQDLRSTQQCAVAGDLFDELVDFHERLARSQIDLPEATAAVLRENLWQLYD